jgi:hypothetical protein
VLAGLLFDAGFTSFQSFPAWFAKVINSLNQCHVQGCGNCSAGVRVTLSDEPNVLLTATVLNYPVQDAGLAAKVGIYSDGVGFCQRRFSLGDRTCITG